MATKDYSDIIDLPYRGKKGVKMSMYQRAAQFAPFAALTGHGDAINETARMVESQYEKMNTDDEIEYPSASDDAEGYLRNERI